MWPLSGENGPSGAWPWNEVRQTSPDPQLTAPCGWVTQGHSRRGEGGEEKESQIHFLANYHPSDKGSHRKLRVNEERRGFYTPVFLYEKQWQRWEQSLLKRFTLNNNCSRGWRQLTVWKNINNDERVRDRRKMGLSWLHRGWGAITGARMIKWC